MRIAQLCPYSVSVPGGVQGQVLGLAHELRRRGHDVDVLAPCDGTPPEGVVALGRSLRFRVNGSTARMAPTPAAARRTVHALRRGDYDVVHLHEPLAPSVTIPALLDHASPVVGTFHAAGDRTPYRWFGWPLRRLAGRLDARVAVSASARELAERHLAGSYTTLFNGIDVAGHCSASPTRVDRPMLLFYGRHEARKGLEVLLAAFATMPDDIMLWIGGDGPAREGLQRRYASDRRLRWLGPLQEADKRSHLRAAAALCAPSLRGESFGMVLLEAMAAQTPVVASDLPGYRALAADGSAAELVAPGNPRALADGLQHVLDPEVAARLRAAGARRAAAFEFADLAHHYETIYTALTAKRR